MCSDKEKNDLENYFDSIRQKNQESQTKLIVTISWAAMIFLLGIGIDKLDNLSFNRKIIFFVTFLLCSLSLLSEFLASLFLEAAASYDIQGDKRGDIPNYLGKLLISIRNALFLVGFIFIIMTFFIIVINKP